MIEERQGDLFASTDLDAFAHGVNCKGVMGSGIAVEFKKRYPLMFKAYKGLCDTGELTRGDIFPWITGELTIYNLATQWNPGADASLSAVCASMMSAVLHAEDIGVTSIGLPKIGAGIGGLEWEDVKKRLNTISTITPVRLVVHYL